MYRYPLSEPLLTPRATVLVPLWCKIAVVHATKPVSTEEKDGVPHQPSPTLTIVGIAPRMRELPACLASDCGESVRGDVTGAQRPGSSIRSRARARGRRCVRGAPRQRVISHGGSNENTEDACDRPLRGLRRNLAHPTPCASSKLCRSPSRSPASPFQDRPDLSSRLPACGFSA